MTAASSTRPLIVLLSLHKQPFWDESYSDLVEQLSAKATVKQLTDLHEAGSYLSTHKASAIIATDEAIVKKPNLSRKLVDYVRNGGTLILGTHFPCFVTYPDLDRWFKNIWNLPWEVCAYTRATTPPNPRRMPSRLTDAKLPGPYCRKAVFLGNVSPEAMVYTHEIYEPDDDDSGADERDEDEIFNRGCPTVFIPIGKGWLGYVGDVNPGEEITQVLVAMCDL